MTLNLQPKIYIPGRQKNFKWSNANNINSGITRETNLFQRKKLQKSDQSFIFSAEHSLKKSPNCIIFHFLKSVNKYIFLCNVLLKNNERYFTM